MRAPAVGIGLRAPHYRELLERAPPLDFLEIHAENFFGEGGAALAWLGRLRSRYALSIHGVGLSLGSVDGLDERHLARLAALVRRFEPMLVSEHLSWSSFGGRHANDLLPLPLTREAALHAAARVERVQERLGRAILVEHVTAYVRFPESEMSEAEFVSEVARRAGCGVLLDVSNAWVNAANHGLDARAFVAAIDAQAVGEIHLAGFEAAPEGLIDTHGAPVAEPVWRLYGEALARLGPRPVVIERDANIPALDALVAEAERARALGIAACAAAA